MDSIYRLVHRAISKDSDKGVRNTDSDSEPVQGTFRFDPIIDLLASTTAHL